MRTIIFLFNFFLLSTLAFTQTGWYNLNSGTGRRLNNLYFIDVNTGWVVGDSIVLKTTNGGTAWTVQTLPAQTTLRSVHFLNASTGFITGDINPEIGVKLYVFKTTDGGNNWFTVNYSNPATFGHAYSYDIYAVNENIIYKTESAFESFSSSGAIGKSINGGINFTGVLSYGTMKGLSFINPQTGWTTSLSAGDVPPKVFKIFRTTNEGNNWSVIYRDSQNNFNTMEGRSIQFLNSNTGYVLGGAAGKILVVRTTNGGIDWIRDTLNNTNRIAMHFVNTTTGWMAGAGSSNISRTTNGGLNWTNQNTGGTQTLYSIYFADTQTGYAVGYYGAIIKTVSGGVTAIREVSNEIPASYSLSQNYPNPFNPVTRIRYDLPRSGSVRLAVYDVTGREVEMLVNEKQSAGSYEAVWDGTRFASGVYFYRLTAEGYGETRKMILIR